MDRVKHFLVNVFAMTIPDRARRSAFRRAVMNFRLRDILAARRFAREECREDSVLLVEENCCHGEVISGYVPYFRKLGFNVDVLVNSAVLATRPFCRQDMSGVRVYHCACGGFRRFLASSRIDGYRHVLLTSSTGYWLMGVDELPIVAVQPEWRRIRSLLVVEHDLRNVEKFHEEELRKSGRLLTLGRFPDGVFACPLCLGQVSVTPKSAITTFICVGAIEGKRKNHAALLSAVEALDERGEEFKVIVVGKGVPDGLSPAARRHVEFTGFVEYPVMFDLVESADFYLPLLDSGVSEHERYVSSGVTGSAQLVYAFSKVPVIDPHFASFYGFDSDNAIVSGDLVGAMTTAIAMDQVEYRRRQERLTRLAAALRDESEANLRRALGVSASGDGLEAAV